MFVVKLLLAQGVFSVSNGLRTDDDETKMTEQQFCQALKKMLEEGVFNTHHPVDGSIRADRTTSTALPEKTGDGPKNKKFATLRPLRSTLLGSHIPFQNKYDSQLWLKKNFIQKKLVGGKLK